MVADFQMADQEQQTFLKEIEKEMPLTSLVYGFRRGWRYSVQTSKFEISHLESCEKLSFMVMVADFQMADFARLKVLDLNFQMGDTSFESPWKTESNNDIS